MLLPIVLATTLATGAQADCRVRFNEATLPVVSHGFWRGIDLGDHGFVEPRIELGICGRPSTTIGNSGIDANIEGWVPLGSGALNVASTQVRAIRYFDRGDEKAATWIAAGVRESRFGGGGANDWSTEVSLEAGTRWQPPRFEKQGLTIWPFFEVAHDFDFFDATFARAGVNHSVGYTSTVPFGLDGTASMAASDYADGFGWHDAEISAWVGYRLRQGIRVAVGGGRVWAADDIGISRNWIGVRFHVLSLR